MRFTCLFLLTDVEPHALHMFTPYFLTDWKSTKTDTISAKASKVTNRFEGK